MGRAGGFYNCRRGRTTAATPRAMAAWLAPAPQTHPRLVPVRAPAFGSSVTMKGNEFDDRLEPRHGRL